MRLEDSNPVVTRSVREFRSLLTDTFLDRSVLSHTVWAWRIARVLVATHRRCDSLAPTLDRPRDAHPGQTHEAGSVDSHRIQPNFWSTGRGHAVNAVDATPQVPDRRPVAVLAGVLAAVVVTCVAAMRGTIVAFDDWNFVLDRRGSGPSFIPGAMDQWLQPHNGHPVMVLVGIYRTAGALVSYNYPAMIGLAALVHAALAAAVYVYSRRRIGPWAALVPALLISVLGRGASVVLSPIVMAFSLALLAGVLAMNVIDGQRDRRPVIVAFLGLFALCSSGLGVARVVTIAADRLPRSRSWQSFAAWSTATAAPLAAFAFWYVNVRDETRRSTEFAGSITFALRLLANGVAALFGVGPDRAPVLAPALALLLGVVLFRRRRAVDWYRLGALAAGLAIDLALVSWARAGNALPASGRYLYVVGAQVALIGVEAGRGLTIAAGRRTRLAAVSSIAVMGAAAAGSGSFRTVATDFRRDNRRTQVALAGFLRAQMNGAVFADDFQPDPEFAPQVTAARFKGLLADGTNPLRGHGPTPRTEEERKLADFFDGQSLVRSVSSEAVANASESAFDFSSTAPVEADSDNIVSETKGRCTTLRSIGVGAFADLQVPLAGGAWRISSTGSTLLQTRRLADTFSGRNVATATLRNDALITVAASSKPSARPWVIRIEPSADAVVCISAH